MHIRQEAKHPFLLFGEHWCIQMSLALASHLGRRNLKSLESSYHVILPLRATFSPKIFVGSSYIN